MFRRSLFDFDFMCDFNRPSASCWRIVFARILAVMLATQLELSWLGLTQSQPFSR